MACESSLEMAIVVSLGGTCRYFTGEELGRICGVSPQRVRKAIAALVARGYRIDEVPGEGFRLAEARALLDGRDIKSRLATGVIGSQVFAFGRVGSTNDVAAALARGGAPDGCLVVAEEQTRGRGRLGRKWYSPPSSGLWFSLVLKPRMRSDISATVSLASALGVADALEERYGISAAIKWPNDVVVRGRKICGILTEAEFSGSRLNFIVVGIGINLLGARADFPPDIRQIATSVLMESGGEVDRGEALAVLAGRIEARYLELQQHGFPGIRLEILRRSSLIGRMIRVETGADVLEGTAADIDQGGALILRETSGSLRRVLAGDVIGVA
jgi:BirA family biotin operon repressor/biotin-[acetyl-CoA-carboxylase] ligase